VPSAPRRPMPRSPEELRALVEERLESLRLWPELHGQAESVRYSLTVGGKRVRPVICLATAEAVGVEPEEALPAGCALELVHTFSLVHDDLPPLDNDDERRGQPSTWKQYGEAVAVLAGDALLAEAFRLATAYDRPHVARELANATLGMIGGQYLDITGTAPNEATLHSLKTGRLFAAAVALALWVAEVPEVEQRPWRAFGEELGLLFQIVDDILDGDGYVLSHGTEGARRLADEAADRARARLGEVDADTSVLRDIVDGLAVRTA
jgi:geranylgeranyl diphosphate synthase, type II